MIKYSKWPLRIETCSISFRGDVSLDSSSTDDLSWSVKHGLIGLQGGLNEGFQRKNLFPAPAVFAHCFVKGAEIKSSKVMERKISALKQLLSLTPSNSQKLNSLFNQSLEMSKIASRCEVFRPRFSAGQCISASATPRQTSLSCFLHPIRP